MSLPGARIRGRNSYYRYAVVRRENALRVENVSAVLASYNSQLRVVFLVIGLYGMEIWDSFEI